MIQASRQLAKGVKRIALADVFPRSVHTKPDFFKMMSLAFEQPPQAQS